MQSAPWLWLALAGCAATPLSPTEAEQQLAAAEAQLAEGDADGALATLAPLEKEACPKRLRDRRDVAVATAHQRLGRPWEAFLALETFADDHPHSELRPTVVEQLWTIGRELAARDDGFLFFWSSRRAARTVLEHLITRHPDTQHLADALRILGDMEFEDGNHELAQQRFRDLMLNRPDSEWFVYAQFRHAMSIVASLEGPDYDLDRMQLGLRELRDFLATRPEQPGFVQQAEAAVALLLEWQVERHLAIAAFYRRVGNAAGERRHVEIASGETFAGTSRHAEAVAARASLAPPPPGGGAP